MEFKAAIVTVLKHVKKKKTMLIVNEYIRNLSKKGHSKTQSFRMKNIINENFKMFSLWDWEDCSVGKGTCQSAWIQFSIHPPVCVKNCKKKKNYYMDQ